MTKIAAPGTTWQAKIREPEFAKRLTEISDRHSRIPALNKGRLTYISREFMVRGGIKLPLETVRKWYAGEAKPRSKNMQMLTEIVDSNVVYLSLGLDPGLDSKTRQFVRRQATGAVNILAGYVQIAGGNAIYPDDKDPRAGYIDLTIIHDNQQRAVHVALGTLDGDSVAFSIPREYQQVTLIGAVPAGDFNIDFVELPTRILDGLITPAGGGFEAKIKIGKGRYFAGKMTMPTVKTIEHLMSIS